MYKWLWIAPAVLLLGCSKSTPPATGVQDTAKSTQAVVQPADQGIEIPRGTPLHVRIDEALSTRRNRVGDGFSATLAESVVMDNRTLLPAGTRVSGHVTISDASGRFKGRARLGLRLDALEYQGRKYPIETTSADRVSANHRRRNTAIIGGGSGLGAIVGAIAGGGKGALIGAGAGAAAGVAGEAITGKKEVSIPAETLLRFTLEAPVRV
jgi:hypothetical protein